MVNEHGIIIVQGAGNNGPFASSIRDDTIDINDEMLTVGAMYWSDKKNVIINPLCEIDKKKKCQPLMTDYSSKGPLPNGSCGVTFVAPGAVIANPTWNPSKKIIFNGTSFASPNAAGSIACLLSALKANSIEYNPSILKLVLSNTAFLPDGDNRLQFGNGILQIDSAFEFFKTFKQILPTIVPPKIRFKRTNEKGIIICKTEKSNITFRSFTKIDINDPRVVVIDNSSDSQDYSEEGGDFEQVRSKKKQRFRQDENQKKPNFEKYQQILQRQKEDHLKELDLKKSEITFTISVLILNN
uniref:Peptidase S8/S53 domain-containing protein n=1 Tax=Panagrolaimus davidi TaxID=227884 RepID=A0A914QYK8_9BILA